MFTRTIFIYDDKTLDDIPLEGVLLKFGWYDPCDQTYSKGIYYIETDESGSASFQIDEENCYFPDEFVKPFIDNEVVKRALFRISVDRYIVDGGELEAFFVGDEKISQRWILSDLPRKCYFDKISRSLGYRTLQ